MPINYSEDFETEKEKKLGIKRRALAIWAVLIILISIVLAGKLLYFKPQTTPRKRPTKSQSEIISSSISKVQVTDIRVDKTGIAAWCVFGKVRNLEDYAVKGYVKIKFLDANGDIVKAATTYVNGGDPINPSQAGPFEYWTEPKDFDGVVNFQIIFVSM